MYIPEFTKDTRGIDLDTIRLSTNEGLAIGAEEGGAEAKSFTGSRKQNANEKWKKGKNTLA